ANPRPGVPAKRDVDRGRVLTDQQVEAVLCTDLPAALLAPLAERLVSLQVQGSRDDPHAVVRQRGDRLGDEVEGMLAAQRLDALGEVPARRRREDVADVVDSGPIGRDADATERLLGVTADCGAAVPGQPFQGRSRLACYRTHLLQDADGGVLLVKAPWLLHDVLEDRDGVRSHPGKRVAVAL